MKKYTILTLLFYLSVIILYPKYYFLIWNVILATVPFYLSFKFDVKNKFIRYINMFIALIFYPNAIYVFTDLIHISRLKFYNIGKKVEYIMDFENWIKLSLIFIALYLSLKLSYLAINNFTKNMSRINKYTSYVVISLLTGIAIYVGRFIRLNSWDLLISPLKTTILILNQLKVENIKYILLFSIIQFIVIIIEEEKK